MESEPMPWDLAVGDSKPDDNSETILPPIKCDQGWQCEIEFSLNIINGANCLSIHFDTQRGIAKQSSQTQQMDPRLLEASYTGNVDQLYSLVRQNVLILNTASLVNGDNPLHVASMAGHVNFVREVLKLKMEFADELNQVSFNPLHIAAARSDVDIVRELLKVGNRLCLVKGRAERTPLHYSAIKGRREVLKELVLACPDSIEEVLAWRESALDLAGKNSRFEAFKLLVKQLKRSNKEHAMNY